MACLCRDISMEKSKFSTDMCWSDVSCWFFLHKSLGQIWDLEDFEVQGLRGRTCYFLTKKCAVSTLLSITALKTLRIPWVWNPHLKMSTENIQWIPQAVESTTVSKCALWIFFFFFPFSFLIFSSSLFLCYCTLRVQFDVPKSAMSSNAVSIWFVLCWQWFGMAKKEWFLIATKPNTQQNRKPSALSKT